MSGAPYWYSEQTGETVWINPHEGGNASAYPEAEVDGYGSAAYPGAEGYSSADAGGAWTQAFDEEGNPYWYTEEGETTYDDPNAY